MKIQILKNGKVIPGQEERFSRLAEEEGKKLLRVDREMRERDPELFADIPFPTDWTEEGRRSLSAASRRFGDGSLHIEE